jgi:hypothetical protein
MPLPGFTSLVQGTGNGTADQAESGNGDSHLAIMAGRAAAVAPSAAGDSNTSTA